MTSSDSNDSGVDGFAGIRPSVPLDPPQPASTSATEEEKVSSRAAAELAVALRALNHDLHELARLALTYLSTLADKARWGVQRLALSIVLSAILLVVVTVFLCACLLRVLDGLAGALLAASGSPWIADLAAGITGAGLIALIAVWRMRVHERATLAALKAKYESTSPLVPPDDPSPVPDAKGDSP